MVFHPDSYTYAPLTPFTDSSDGKMYVYAVAHAALTAKTPYFVIVNEYGHVTEALPTSGKYGYVGVPNDTVASGALAKLQIGGYCADMITTSLSISVGHGLTVNTAAVADIGADYSGVAGEFAACCTESTTSTTQDVMLCGHMIITI